jgi:arabinose-5-phosphate isomerase
MTDAINIAKQVIQIEMDGLHQISQNLGESFQIAVDKVLQTKGRTIVCGMGKSGIIGKNGCILC